MCGIAGYYGVNRIPEYRIRQTLELMRRRGPDHAAWRHWMAGSDKNTYLLHSRLNIIDLDPRSNQPFQLGNKWIAFNGELYNYLERRSELEALGRSFATESDTEVLLRAIDHFSWSVLDRCEGMWAFAVYDEAEGSLTLCRDRFGEKSLYLFPDKDGVYFGSEVKFLASLMGRRLEVNHDHLFRYMVNGYKALYKARHTFFKGLTELRPATILKFSADGREETESYWTPACEPDDGMSYDQAVAGARERLIRSVELRLRADVPLAFCMSGGVDSNVLLSVAKRVFDYDVHGFTIANIDARYEEQELVDHSVAQLGIRHTSVPTDTRDFLPRLRRLIIQHDAPVYTISYFAHWLLMESIAAHGYRISISGTGADELFTGYFDHHIFYLYEVLSDKDMYGASFKAWQEKVQPIVRNPFLKNPELFFGNPSLRDHIFLDAAEFAGYLTIPWDEPFAERNMADSILRNRMLNEMFCEVIPAILHEDDLNAMYFSIENRSPFLDRDLFEFCFKIPSRHLVRNGCAKAILRDSMRGIAPDRILDNPRKVGFNAPIFSFLDTRDPDTRAYLLDDSPIYQYVKRDKIEALISKDFVPNSQSKFIFYFLCSKMFIEEFG